MPQNLPTPAMPQVTAQQRQIPPLRAPQELRRAGTFYAIELPPFAISLPAKMRRDNREAIAHANRMQRANSIDEGFYLHLFLELENSSYTAPGVGSRATADRVSDNSTTPTHALDRRKTMPTKHSNFQQPPVSIFTHDDGGYVVINQEKKAAPRLPQRIFFCNP